MQEELVLTTPFVSQVVVGSFAGYQTALGLEFLRSWFSALQFSELVIFEKIAICEITRKLREVVGTRKEIFVIVVAFGTTDQRGRGCKIKVFSIVAGCALQTLVYTNTLSHVFINGHGLALLLHCVPIMTLFAAFVVGQVISTQDVAIFTFSDSRGTYVS